MFEWLSLGKSDPYAYRTQYATGGIPSKRPSNFKITFGFGGTKSTIFLFIIALMLFGMGYIWHSSSKFEGPTLTQEQLIQSTQEGIQRAQNAKPR